MAYRDVGLGMPVLYPRVHPWGTSPVGLPVGPPFLLEMQKILQSREKFY